MIEQVIEARAAKEGVDHIIFAPRVVTHPHLIGAADTLQEFVGFIIFSIRDRRAWEKKLNGMRMGNKLRHYALTIDSL